MFRKEKMQKIIVIGCPGSGKTTFAEKLRDKLDLPLYHLDAIWHRADKTNISREEFDARLGEILCRDEWIIDGNYSRTLERRMAACDGIFLFDLPVDVCIEGVLSRIGKKRPDMPWIETELDVEFEREIREFGSKNLSEIYRLLDKYKDGRKVFIFKSRDEAVLDETINKT